MSNIIKGLQLNEVDPRNFDSDIDYYNALNRRSRKPSIDDYDSSDFEKYDDEPIQRQPAKGSRPEYSVSQDEDKNAIVSSCISFLFLFNKFQPAISDFVGFTNNWLDAIFSTKPFAYFTPSKVCPNCPEESPSPSTVANEGYK